MTRVVVGFRLETIPEAELAFFECEANGCRGCGCPPFRYTTGDGARIPEMVIEHLLEHVQKNHEG